jgi:serine/threonine-protein kinase
VYCLGATLYHLLTGKSPADPPYEIVPIRQIDPSFSPGLEKVISKCVQQNPAARYQNCAELYYALENYDKADDKYYKKQRRKMRIFIALVILTAMLALGGGVGVVGHGVIVRSNYEDLLEQVNYVSAEDREQYYVNAIRLMPGNTNAYLKLIAHYEQDGTLSAHEYNTISPLLDKNRGSLKAQSDYSLLAYEIGKLYWYYYESKDTYSRSMLARDWFKDTAESNNASLQTSAQVHFRMTSLVVDLSKGKPEGVTAGAYRQYYDNLTELATLLGSESSDVVKLRGCTIILVTIQKDIRFFKVDGLSKNEIIKLYDATTTTLAGLAFDQVAFRELYDQKQMIERLEPSIKEAIDDAYRI